MFPIHSEAIADDDLIFARIETQGWRQTMEDSILFEKITGFNDEIDNIFGIFDGHGGYLVSLFCKVIFGEVMFINM